MYYVIAVKVNGQFVRNHSGDSQADALKECQKENKLTDREALILLYNGSLHLECGDHIDFSLYNQAEDYDV